MASYQRDEIVVTEETEASVTERLTDSKGFSGPVKVVFFCLSMISVGLMALASSGSKVQTSEYASSSSSFKSSKKSTIMYTSLSDAEKAALFDEFKAQFGKTYSTHKEEEIKFANFKATLELIDERNAADDKAVHGINKFADLSTDEFKSLLGFIAPSSSLASKAKKDKVQSNKKIIDQSSDYVNWAGTYTTAVKDQGYCGSCWAFSAVSQVESDAIRAGYLTTDDQLSEQQLVSCDSYDSGCNGGNPYYAYYYIYNAGGVESNTSYPYTSYWDDDGSCSSNSSLYEVTVTDFYYLTSETAMINHVSSTGPLSVCVDADSWSTYTSGIITTCGDSVDHCVQATGINTADSYWIIRNSWGTDWGIDGYIYVKSGENMCDITYLPTYVTVKEV